MRDVNSPYDRYQQLWRQLQDAIDESAEALRVYRRLLREHKLLVRQIGWIKYTESNPEWWKLGSAVNETSPYDNNGGAKQ